MKRQKMKITWKKLFEEDNKILTTPKGYSSIGEIAEKSKLKSYIVDYKLKKARALGEVEAIRARNRYGKIVWFYKD